ncbi:uracil-DNA glycosylase family protein [Nakamurella aerolata]|uniref:Type-5 uracil-DNA glycosylase n=1 Tax=Nakamurella aerolata TaxID=1656892 RepID=A0A849A718_9ACTN|nr:uracil-DNA glycosylase [Nakamurella aerolata]
MTPSPAQRLLALDTEIAGCRRCPRLVAWREQVARDKRASFADQTYWGRPVPGFGPVDARIGIVGLAPAAHGANRTGRMFTGDRSGDFLYAALHRAGLASQPDAVSIDDGLTLRDVRITAPVHCAPPDNKPTPAERDNCAPYLASELDILHDLRVVIVLGSFGWQAMLKTLGQQGWPVPRPRPKFAHGAELRLTNGSGRSLTLLGCFHVSQQNTFTGRLTPAMLGDVVNRAKQLSAVS